MKCPTCNLKRRSDRILGTVWVHEDNCVTGKEEAEDALPFEAMGNPDFDKDKWEREKWKNEKRFDR